MYSHYLKVRPSLAKNISGKATNLFYKLFDEELFFSCFLQKKYFFRIFYFL